MTEFDARGQWWLPGAAGNVVPGHFVCDSTDGLALVLEGSLSDAHGDGGLEPESAPLVLGVSDGKLVTLVDVHAAGFTVQAPGALIQRFRPDYAVLGAHFVDREQVVFRQIDVAFDGLAEWIGEWGATYEFDLPEGKLTALRFTYSQPEPVPVHVVDAQVVLHRGAVTNFGSAGIESRPDASFAVTPARPERFPRLLIDYVHPLQDLLVLAFDEACAIRKMTAWADSDQLAEAQADPEKVGLPVLHWPRFSGQLDRRGVPTEGLIRFTDLEGDPSLVAKWLELRERYGPAITLLFATYYFKQPIGENQFLNLIQSVEAYHRRRFPQPPVSADAHAARMRSILGAVPEEHREWLAGKLQFSNEWTLRERLKQLIKAIDATELVDRFVGKVPTFVQRVVVARNYFAHWSSDREAGWPSQRDLQRISGALRVLMQVLLLEELGIDHDLIPERVESTRGFRLAESLASE